MRLINADYAKEYAKKYKGNINYPQTIPSIDDIPTVDAIPRKQIENLIQSLENAYCTPSALFDAEKSLNKIMEEYKAIRLKL